MIDGADVTDRKGVTIADERELVRHALFRLRLGLRGVVNATWVDVGSVAEQEEMKAHFNSSRHRVFRELDPRRYSMYFGRWVAYQQARNYERENGLHYAWFVHTRFDMAFGAPIQPYFKWPSTKLWVHDTWASEVPDIFALIPAAFADAYFSMDLLVQDKVMCLGGPNFNKASVEDKALIAMGFIEDERYIAKKALCAEDRDGGSEEIFRRKLILANISFESQTIGFIPIFSFILRGNLNELCQLVHPSLMIGKLWDTQSANGAMYSGCLEFVQKIRQEVASPRCPSLPFVFDPENGEDECQVESKVSEGNSNYMPSRIRLPARQGGHCLTVIQMNAKDTFTLSFAPCIAHEKIKLQPKIRHTYSISQLFQLNTFARGPQQISNLANMSSESVQWLCLTSTLHESVTASQLEKYPLLNNCIQNKEEQFFIIPLLERRSRRIQGHNEIKSLTEFGLIARNRTCLSYSRAAEDGSSAISLFWKGCKSHFGAGSDPSVRQVFVFEKTYL